MLFEPLVIQQCYNDDHLDIVRNERFLLKQMITYDQFDCLNVIVPQVYITKFDSLILVSFEDMLNDIDDVEDNTVLLEERIGVLEE